jgi:uncharacterized protein YutE (UPF0331/DUF86 family)
MNDIIIHKIQSIQRCVARAREEHRNAGDAFRTDYTRQDAAILNLTRACEQAIDLANHVIRNRKLGIPAASGESFDILSRNKIIPPDLARILKKMTGFRNLAVHEYQEINLSIVEDIILNRSEDLIRYTELLLPLAR